MGDTLLSLQGLSKQFATKYGPVKAVDGVDLDLGVGETLAIVGESGCGKSTLAMAMMGLIEPDQGTVAFDGETPGPIAEIVKRHRGRGLSIVFQNPHSALNPKMRVQALVGEPLITAFSLNGRPLRDRVVELLEAVGLGREHLRRFPHEFSGGQRQRIAIARALALEPKVLILDEPTAALDVSVQAQILKLLKRLQSELGVSYLFITHDLGTVAYFANRILVMYLGRIVEQGAVDAVFAAPHHPYTKALLAAIPSINPDHRDRLQILRGEIPSPLNRPPGCSFAPRCNRASDQCRDEVPTLTGPHGGRKVACINPLATGTQDQEIDAV